MRTFVGSTITRLGVLAVIYFSANWGLHRLAGIGLRETAFPAGVRSWQNFGIGALLTVIPMTGIFIIEITQGWLVVEAWAWQVKPYDAFLRSIWISLLSNLDAGVGEEILFRGFLLWGLCKAWNKPIGLIASALIFSVVHIFVAGASESHWLFFALLLTLPGVLLGIAYLRSGSLWLPIGIHFIWDLVYDLFNFTGSSHPGLFGLVTRQQGPGWFMGTNFGIEVGLAGVLVLICVGAGVWLWTNPKPAGLSKPQQE